MPPLRRGPGLAGFPSGAADDIRVEFHASSSEGARARRIPVVYRRRHSGRAPCLLFGGGQGSPDSRRVPPTIFGSSSMRPLRRGPGLAGFPSTTGGFSPYIPLIFEHARVQGAFWASFCPKSLGPRPACWSGRQSSLGAGGPARIRARGRHSRLGPRFPPRIKGSGVARIALSQLPSSPGPRQPCWSGRQGSLGAGGAARIRARGRHSRLGPRFPPRTKGSGVTRTACVRAFSVRYLPGQLRNTSSYSAKAGAPICGKGMLGEKRSALVAAVAPPWIRPEGRIELARLLFRGGQGSPVSRLVP